MSSVYFGGSRSLPRRFPVSDPLVRTVINTGYGVHVGCQAGADHRVIMTAAPYRQPLTVFAVAPTLTQAPAHVQEAARWGCHIVLAAGGTVAPIKARFLLRSIAAFQGCESAIFFLPGSGSLAVAREATRAKIPVFAFSPAQPAAIPSTAGLWVTSSFLGFECWQWSAPSQPPLFAF